MNQKSHFLVVQIGMHYAKHAFEEDMKITFDLGLRRRGTGNFDDEDIWAEVGDMIPVLPPCEFVNQIWFLF